ncbi:MAG: alpha/beta fold hydrolase [Proteobacteria bacterium]|nr:alpha/beta fold hydrolase [Pseudomonadota bacterium]MBU1741542.1 alpha/beta fold hydrolase [Pseudomonadota bacterium]
MLLAMLAKLALATIYFVLAVLGGYGCPGPLPSAGLPQSGTYQEEIRSLPKQGARDFLVHVPSGYTGKRPFPLVVVLHGAFSTARLTERLTGFSRLADREGFIVAYPNGFGFLGLFQHWNAGHCCGWAMRTRLDDVGFVAEVIKFLSLRLRVDKRRVYLVGYSNGGMLAYRFAAERSDLVAAVAVVAGTVGSRAADGRPQWSMPRPKRMVPVIAFHGRQDDSVPYGGGRSSNGLPVHFVSTLDSVLFWARSNRCAWLPGTDMLNGGRVLRYSWCASSPAPVILFTLRAWGHQWPGGTETANLKDGLRFFDVAPVIWRFVSKYRR